MSKSVVVLLLIIVTMLTTSTFALERKKKGGFIFSMFSKKGECKERGKGGWKDCVASHNAKGKPCYWCEDGKNLTARLTLMSVGLVERWTSVLVMVGSA